MNHYKADLYPEILEFYETSNTPINGNAFHGTMECTDSSEELRSDGKGDEDNL